jgi:hypothetical protein
MKYGETCIPGRMDNLHPTLTVADVKLWCDESHGYPNFGFWLFFLPSILIVRIYLSIKIYLSICGLRGAEEVDEVEDYEVPGSNSGQEL